MSTQKCLLGFSRIIKSMFSARTYIFSKKFSEAFGLFSIFFCILFSKYIGNISFVIVKLRSLCCDNMGKIRNVEQKHLLEVPETCKDTSPSGLGTPASTCCPAGDLVPVFHTSPCRQSARKRNTTTGQKSRISGLCGFFVSFVVF